MLILILRTLIVYFSLLLVMRLLGKRQLGEMELSEFILAALIADMAAHPLQDIGIPLINALIPIAVLFCCEVLISGLSLKSLKLRMLMFGKPSIIIDHGKIVQSEMVKNRFAVDELLQELRSLGKTDISYVEYGILETNGKLSVLPYPSKLPATAEQMGVATVDGGYPIIIINDGRLLSENLNLSGHDEDWLNNTLREHGANSAEDVFLMTVNSAGQVYFAGKEKK